MTREDRLADILRRMLDGFDACDVPEHKTFVTPDAIYSANDWMRLAGEARALLYPVSPKPQDGVYCTAPDCPWPKSQLGHDTCGYTPGKE